MTTDRSRLDGLSSAERRALLKKMVAERQARPRAYPVSFAQQRLWFMHQLLPESPVYNVPIGVRLTGPLDAGALSRSLNEVVRRHDVLRTTFESGSGGLQQVVAAQLELAITTTDLGHIDPRERWDQALRLAEEEARRPFDLALGPLVRARLFRLDAGHHLLLLSLHHVVIEQASVGILLGEIEKLYAPDVAPPGLTDLPIQYADYAHWQLEQFSGGSLEPSLSYWRRQLQAPLPILELPTDRRRPAVQTFAGAWRSSRLSKQLGARLAALSRHEGVTLFMTLVAGYAILLHRYTGAKELLVGTPVADRGRTETDPLIGLFLNTVALRLDLGGGPSFRDFLRQVRQTVVAALTHQDVPFEKVVEDLSPDRDLSHTPLFQVMFNMQNTPTPELHLAGGVSGRVLGPGELHTGSSKVDLALFIEETPEGLDVGFEFNTDLFEAATIEGMARRFERLLEGVVVDPDQRIDALPWLSDSERQQLLVDWNATATEHPRNQCIQQLVEAQAARTPKAVAVVDGDRQLTYGALNARANQIAHRLIELGVGPEVPVGICLDRSTNLVVGMLGILKAGGAYVPLDPNYPAERLAFMLADTRAPVLVTEAGLLDPLPPFAGHVLSLDRDETAIAAQPDTDPICRATAETLAYIIYTSGSTGIPKGVMARHQGIARLVCDSDYVQLDASDCVAHASNPSFDAATFEVWGALANGARLLIVARDLALDPPRLGDTLRSGGVSTLFLTTGLFNEVVRARPGAFAGVKQVLFGGEAVDPHWVSEACNAGGPQRLLHVYGPTETTTFATWHEVKTVVAGEVTIPIGRPISNTRAYVLDARQEPVPVGVAGELYIAGDGLARGYWNRPELTARAFVPDPFASTPGARMYRTGDRVRLKAEGAIEFLGRFDNQVKIRGFRIEPGEVEAVLASHPAVAHTVVLHREDAPGDRRLVAYVVPAGVSAIDHESLGAFVRERLPDYMNPSAYVTLDRLPLNPNGKIDRPALPAPQTAKRSRDTVIWPANPTEKQLVHIWQDLLDVRPVGVTDNFFELGGHSLLAVRLMYEIEQACGRRLPLLTLFEGATIRQLARALLDRDAETPAAPMTAIHPGGSRLPFFFLHGDFNGGGFYSVALARHLGSDQPFYAIHPHGLDGRVMRFTIESMAEDHLANVRAVQPKGPYLLGGHCNGGLIALEMARRLLADGEGVGLLAVLDAPVKAAGAEQAPDDDDSRQRPAGTALAEAYLGAISTYVPHRFPGLVTLFYSGSRQDTDLEAAWQALAGELRVFRIAGNHLNFITRDVHVLGEQLRACLDAVQQNGGTT